ncbi:hypothetical protein GFV16_13355 [Bacillus megaterium]|nr:hypothetical protein [Priestia megaterium]
MTATYNHLKDVKKEEGHKEVLERTLKLHRNKRWVINSIYVMSLLAAILCFYFHVQRAGIIVFILICMCTTSEILYKTLDKKIELRLKRIKQEKRKSIFKGNKP